MIETIFFLCAAMSALCAYKLARGYKSTANKILFWSALCFGLVALNNAFLFIDMVVFPEVNLSGPFIRNVLTALAGSVLLSGLITELT